MNSRGMPSMVALLGLLAVAGYQNREKISEMLRGQGQAGGRPGAPGASGQGGGLGGVLGNLGGLLGGASAGSVLSGGLGDLVDRLRQQGHGEAADSWVARGPNKQLSAQQLEQALGSDVVDNLVQRTGLTREDLLSRLARTLPEAVDKYTPDGRLPSAEEADRQSDARD
ncbi:MAG TPA: YidB family protein [Aestuariivirgaceae bacterium]|nr:YidB family protein [Aestuariivirgaceae bacterium]